jgi:glucose-6-phosphate isomerase
VLCSLTQKRPSFCHTHNNKRSHLRELLADEARCEALIKDAGGVTIDFSRQNATQETLKV